MKKSCAILLGMGGPDTTDDVREFLYNIFSDRAIIRLPGGPLLQKPFASLISRLRQKKVKVHYQLIGGGSPLLKWTNLQRVAIEENIRQQIPGFRCFIGMRYFRPTIEDAIEKAVEAGFERIVLLPLYPQYCRATTGSSFRVVNRQMLVYPKVSASYVKDFHRSESYIALLREYIDRELREDEVLLFSAHSIPEKFVEEGDPYVAQVRETVALVAGAREHYLSFQSRSGPVKWVGPDTVEEVKRLVISEQRKVFIVPISFVCDHIETLYEIDIELKEMLPTELRSNIRRMSMFNDDPRFASLLSGLIRNEVNSHVEV